MPDPQFVACTFRDSDTRTYTYSNEGDPVAPGDFVKVADNRDPTAWKRVRVVAIVDRPTFDCKPILGRVDDDMASDAEFLKEMTK